MYSTSLSPFTAISIVSVFHAITPPHLIIVGLVITSVVLFYFLYKEKKNSQSLKKEMLYLKKLARFSKELLFTYNVQTQVINFHTKSERTKAYLNSSKYLEVLESVKKHLEQITTNGVVVINHQTEDEMFVLRLFYFRPSPGSSTIIGKIVDVKDEVEQKELLIEKATTDSLTQLHNSGHTSETIKNLLGNKPSSQKDAIFLIDLNDFKTINDTLGHFQGDVALKVVANTLKTVFHEASVIGRIGGDEFMVYMEDIDFDEDHCSYAETFLNALANAKFPMPINSSIGVCIISQRNNYNEAIHLADSAMYAAKKQSQVNKVKITKLTSEAIKKQPLNSTQSHSPSSMS